MMWGHGFGGHGFGFPGMIFGGLMMLVFWGAIIVLVFFVIRALSRTGSVHSAPPPAAAAPAGDRALDILRERYARGEITKEQFEQMRRDLST
jgi:putative membrane protein